MHSICGTKERLHRKTGTKKRERTPHKSFGVACSTGPTVRRQRPPPLPQLTPAFCCCGIPLTVDPIPQ